MQIARVPRQREPQLRFALKMNLPQRCGELLQRCHEVIPVGAVTVKKIPVQHRRCVGDFAADADLRSGQIRAKMIQRPGVTGEKPQYGLEIGERKRIRRRERQREFAVAQDESVQLPAAVQQRGKIQLQLHRARGQRRAGGRLHLPGANIFRDKTVDQTQAHPGKFQVHPAFRQGGDEPRLQKIRQPYAVAPKSGGEHRQHRKPRGEADAAEGNAALAPKARHITAR